MDRRSFLKTSTAVGSAWLMMPESILGAPSSNSHSFFSVHPFIEQNPNAVFIMRTNVDSKTNSDAKLNAALNFGRSVFVNPDDGSGTPISHRIAIKPNLTTRLRNDPKYTIEGSMGIVTDAYFVEGVIESIKELGLSGNQFYLREVNTPEDFEDGGYWDMVNRTGADLRDLAAIVGEISEDDLQWIDVPNGVWFRRIPYLWPANSSDTFLINIAKFKAHCMGLTLCLKNLQGAIAHNYQAHCRKYGKEMDMADEHKNPDAWTEILENYNRHVADGIPRWDRPGDNETSGLGMETWITRCLDNNSVTHPQLHIIEGIYGRDGHFLIGPDENGLATDYMTNVIIFGKNPVYVDIVGHWLGGHEPGNFGLFHIAKERGHSSVLNPMAIPLYEWKADGTATLTDLTDFERIPLKTMYLRRDYNGQTEDQWHLCDENYDYGPTHVNSKTISQKPDVFILLQNHPNPFNPSTTIAFTIPKAGNTRLDIYNTRGEVIDVLIDHYCQGGSHMVSWNSNNCPSGLYFYRLRFGSFSETKRMVLVR